LRLVAASAAEAAQADYILRLEGATVSITVTSHITPWNESEPIGALVIRP